MPVVNTDLADHGQGIHGAAGLAVEARAVLEQDVGAGHAALKAKARSR